MGTTKDKHLRQERDRGQGWDRRLFDRNPGELQVHELREELAKRKLSTEGNRRQLQSRFIKALCIGIPVGGYKTKKSDEPDDKSGAFVAFPEPPTAEAAGCVTIGRKGRQLEHNDAADPRWTTLQAYFPAPENAKLRWIVSFPHLYSAIVGVARAPASPDEFVGSDEDGWGYFVNLSSKHHNDPAGKGEKYGTYAVAGDLVTIEMDTAKGTLSFKVGTKDVGVAFSDITGTVYPTISLLGKTTCLVMKSEVIKEEATPQKTEEKGEEKAEEKNDKKRPAEEVAEEQPAPKQARTE